MVFRLPHSSICDSEKLLAPWPCIAVPRTERQRSLQLSKGCFSLEGVPISGPSVYIDSEIQLVRRVIISDVTYEVKDQVACITLNRPDKRNAFSPQMLRMWRDALLEAQQSDAVRCILITGAGKDFCAGGDLQNMHARLGENALDRKESLVEQIQVIPLTLAAIDKPVVAAVNGSATGAGMDMALMCDFRFAGETSRFAEKYIHVGIVPGAGGAWFLPRLVGTSMALELLLTGRWVPAQEARSLGLVNHVVADEDLMEASMAFARQLCEAPPITVRTMKRAVLQAVQMDLRAHLDQISSHMSVITATQDHREALTALMEKRQPVFQGR